MGAVANESLQQTRVHYYSNAPSDVVNTHFEVNSDIERAENQRNAIECMEIERFMRIQTEHMAAVADAVRRFVAQKDSLNTMNVVKMTVSCDEKKAPSASPAASAEA